MSVKLVSSETMAKLTNTIMPRLHRLVCDAVKQANLDLGDPIRRDVAAHVAAHPEAPQDVDKLTETTVTMMGEMVCAVFGIPRSNEGKPVPVPGCRVKVTSGDGLRELGEGEYVGDVTAYFVRVGEGEDMKLISLPNAEVEPNPALLPPGAVVDKMDNIPKIRLDSGETVYGCQVWWEAVPEEGAEDTVKNG